jgi:hypothetical protein
MQVFGQQSAAHPKESGIAMNILTMIALEAPLMEVLTSKGKEIMGAMKDQYGGKKGESVFYASKNKGTIKGVEECQEALERFGKKMHQRHVMEPNSDIGPKGSGTSTITSSSPMPYAMSM